MDFHHIGIACSDIDKTKVLYNALGYLELDDNIIIDKIQNVKLIFMKKKNHPLIELVSPLNNTSPVNNILKKNGNNPYHTCYEVDNILKSIKKLKLLNFILINKPSKAIAFDSRLICFLYNKDFGLIELLNKY